MNEFRSASKYVREMLNIFLQKKFKKEQTHCKLEQFTVPFDFLIDGTITVEDLENYYTSVEEPLSVRLYNENYTVIAPQPPSSGVVLEFMLKILDGKYFSIVIYLGRRTVQIKC